MMIHVIYKGRALPLAWRVRQAPRGTFLKTSYRLVALVRELIPGGTKVVFLGDGEFDGIKLQETMNEAGWWYACRTAHGNTATWEDETFHVEELGACPAGAADRAQGGGLDPRCVWSGDAAVLLGEGACGAVVFGQ